MGKKNGNNILDRIFLFMATCDHEWRMYEHHGVKYDVCNKCSEVRRHYVIHGN